LSRYADFSAEVELVPLFEPDFVSVFDSDFVSALGFDSAFSVLDLLSEELELEDFFLASVE
jgi:hypothetical protein